MSVRRHRGVPWPFVLCLAALPAIAGAAASQVTKRDGPVATTFLITSEGMAGLTLGTTLEQTRRTLKGVLFERTSDGDGAALVTVTLPGGHHVVLFANEEDPDTSIDWTRRIAVIEAFEPAFATAEGVRVGMLVTDVAARFGPVREIVKSEIESREYVTFERQPKAFRFRLDYSGQFDGSNRTTKHRADAKIFSIAVSAPESSRGR